MVKIVPHITSDKAWTFWFLPTIWYAWYDRNDWHVGFRWLAWDLLIGTQ